MKETKISLGTGLVYGYANFNKKILNSSVKKLLRDFGLSRNDLVNISIGYEGLCEIHSLAKSLHERVKKL